MITVRMCVYAIVLVRRIFSISRARARAELGENP